MYIPLHGYWKKIQWVLKILLTEKNCLKTK